jgi:hypothetical protein
MHDAKKKIKDFLFTKDLLVNSNKYFISFKQCILAVNLFQMLHEICMMD